MKILATGDREGLAVLLLGQLNNNPDLLKERRQAFEKEHGVKDATATMVRTITRLPEIWTLKEAALRLVAE